MAKTRLEKKSTISIKNEEKRNLVNFDDTILIDKLNQKLNTKNLLKKPKERRVNTQARTSL